MLSILLLGCSMPGSGDPSGDSGAAPELSWHQDARPIIESHCLSCHSVDAAVSFPLETYDQVAGARAGIADAVSSGRMPPWLADGDCNDYAYDISLSEDEKGTLLDWIELGAPEGDPEASVAGELLERLPMERVDVELALPPYVPSDSQDDDYRCFPVALDLDQPGYVTGYEILPENPGLVHHVVLYLAPPEMYEDFVGLDEAEDGAGYTCYGSPGLLGNDADWIGAWAPGAVTGAFPNGTGISVEPGQVVIAQLHYNLVEASPAQDDTLIQLMIDETVENPAVIQPWADEGWLDSDEMLIPAGSEGTTHSWGYDIPGAFSLQIHSASLHMHELGRSARIWTEDDEGNTECVLDIPAWDFNWQRSYLLAEPVVVSGERLNIECTWDNPTDQDVVWGDGTADEMCLGTMLMSY
jgi:hypothetical protein